MDFNRPTRLHKLPPIRLRRIPHIFSRGTPKSLPYDLPRVFDAQLKRLQGDNRRANYKLSRCHIDPRRPQTFSGTSIGGHPVRSSIAPARTLPRTHGRRHWVIHLVRGRSGEDQKVKPTDTPQCSLGPPTGARGHCGRPQWSRGKVSQRSFWT